MCQKKDASFFYFFSHDFGQKTHNNIDKNIFNERRLFLCEKEPKLLQHQYYHYVS